MWAQLGCDNTFQALLRGPKQANGAVDFQAITFEMVAVTAEGAKRERIARDAFGP